MSDQLLTTLKIALLAVIYLFFARVLWAVWTEVRVPTAPGLTARQTKTKAGTSTPKNKGGKSADAPPSKLLVVEPAAMRGSTVSLDNDIVVGRAEDCEVTLADDPFVSTRHARFFQRDGIWWVEDLGSTNGTLVNAQRLTEAHQIRRDDRVQAGSAVFEVH
jgi:pSer/pThr/pTyr-binding forkhead associated (FHA) protein